MLLFRLSAASGAQLEAIKGKKNTDSSAKIKYLLIQGSDELLFLLVFFQQFIVTFFVLRLKNQTGPKMVDQKTSV